jgi:hypothetical protein
MQIPGPDGQLYDFPKDATYQEITDFFHQESPEGKKEAAIAKAMKVSGRTTIDTLKDVATGLGNAGQNIGNFFARKAMGTDTAQAQQRALQANNQQVPEFIAKQAGRQIPRINMQETFGTQEGNPFTQIGSQYGLGGMLGGASLPGQVLANSAFGATQAQPGEQNLFGLLPKGEIGGAMEGALMGALPFGVGKLAKYAKKGLDFLSPGKRAEKFMTELGHGASPEQLKAAMQAEQQQRGDYNILNSPPEIPKMTPPTSEENITELGKRMTAARKSAEQEALIPKEELFKTESKKPIIPSQKRSKELANEVAKIFEKKAVNPLDKKTSKSLATAIREYYKTGNIDKLVSRGETIFEHGGLSNSELKLLDKTLEMEPLKNGKYLSRKDVNKNYKSMGLEEVHNNYANKTTVENADKLKIEMAKEKRKLEDIKKRTGDLTGNNRIKYERLVANEKALLEDMQTYFNTLSPEKQNMYKSFREKWAINKEKYDKPTKKVAKNKVIQALSKNDYQELSSQEVKNAFKNPSKKVKAVLQDIGPEGQRNILYNALSHLPSGDWEALAKTLLEAKQVGGYQHYIKPEHIDLAKSLLKGKKYQRATKYGAYGLAGLAGGGAALKKFL